jgi:adenylosuccinate synthase
VGPAIEERVRRSAMLAGNVTELQPYVTDVAKEVNGALNSGKEVILEGTQGLMLSLFHGTYPYVTGRDTGASAICSEAGVGPTKVDKVLIVLKSFITRVGAGSLPGELSKEEAVKRGWFEIAAGTGRERRSAPFNFHVAKRAAMINGATEAVLTKLDIMFPHVNKARNFGDLPKEATDFIADIEKQIEVPIVLIGTGPDVLDVIDRRE